MEFLNKKFDKLTKEQYKIGYRRHLLMREELDTNKHIVDTYMKLEDGFDDAFSIHLDNDGLVKIPFPFRKI